VRRRRLRGQSGLSDPAAAPSGCGPGRRWRLPGRSGLGHPAAGPHGCARLRCRRRAERRGLSDPAAVAWGCGRPGRRRERDVGHVRGSSSGVEVEGWCRWPSRRRSVGRWCARGNRGCGPGSEERLRACGPGLLAAWQRRLGRGARAQLDPSTEPAQRLGQRGRGGGVDLRPDAPRQAREELPGLAWRQAKDPLQSVLRRLEGMR